MTDDPREDAPEHAGPDDQAEDGVDVSLVRWALSLQPGERLAWLQSQADSLMKLRNASAER